VGIAFPTHPHIVVATDSGKLIHVLPASGAQTGRTFSLASGTEAFSIIFPAHATQHSDFQVRLCRRLPQDPTRLLTQFSYMLGLRQTPPRSALTRCSMPVFSNLARGCRATWTCRRARNFPLEQKRFALGASSAPRRNVELLGDLHDADIGL
jgi:hypothetical protein